MKRNQILEALIDEYRKSTIELQLILSNLNQERFNTIIDKETADKDCVSIQSVVFHVVQSGHTYANYINSINNRVWFEYNTKIETPLNGVKELNLMLNYTENAFEGLWQLENNELEQFKFKTRWNVTYDIEQLMEHAIVHVLRHRRQIQNMILKNKRK